MNTKFTAIIATTVDTPNRNGIIYSKAAMEEAIKKMQPIIDEGRLMGELGQGSSAVNLGNVSHKIDKLWIEDGKGYGDITILNTPQGKIVEDLLNIEPTPVSLGMRCIGTPEYSTEDPKIGVVKDLSIITMDIIQNEQRN